MGVRPQPNGKIVWIELDLSSRRPGRRSGAGKTICPPLPLGVAGHEGNTVLVGLNGLRLLSRRSWAGHRTDRQAQMSAAESVAAGR